jgi:hypothetical protein
MVVLRPVAEDQLRDNVELYRENEKPGVKRGFVQSA